LIGPEGDFSVAEVELAQKQGYQAVHMNDFRLRTETAALLAVAKLAQLNS
jgi:16S rRNA (uracil1498-N3)-methyltransferase